MNKNSATSKFDLQGKVAVITGGAGLLGIQHALALLDCGATVAITDINEEALAQEEARLRKEFPQGVIVSCVMDVTDLASIDSVLQLLIKQFGGVHILVNNAAIDPKVKDGVGIVETSRLENFPRDQWDFQLNVGLTGALLCTQVFGSWMAQHNAGVILNVASDLSVIAPDQRLYRKEGLPEHLQPVKPVTYSVIKAGLIGLTRYTAGYWANKGVRTNALSPGGVYNGQSEEFVTKLTNLIPMGRMAVADEYAAAVQFLCSDASKYMTGQNIVMDGGRSVL
jgi:NAD(P)-dependent dehydrogenase (short-subunit alcohol dehydrogenase family)